MIDRILGEDRQLVRLDHLGDAVVDLGVDVVRTPCEKNRMLTRLGDAVEDLLPVVAHVLPILLDLGIARVNGGGDLLFPDPLRLAELLHKPFNHALSVVDRQKWLDKADVLLTQDIHIDADVLRVGRNNRAVEIICRRTRLVLHVVRLTGIEDRVDALFYEVNNVPMRELCGVAERVRRNRRHALIEELRRGFPRNHNPVAELVKEREPERIVLVHIQRARDTDASAARLCGRFVVLEYTTVLELVDVRRIVLAFFAADAALTAVAREVALAVRELLHCDQALVAAFPAAIGAGLHLECTELIRAEQGRPLRTRLKCENRRAVCAHEPRDIGTDDILSEDVLKGTQDGIVVERPALYDDVVAERRDVLDLHDLEQCVLDDRECDARRDVGDLCPLLLRLFDLRVHKDRAARAKVDGCLCIHRLARKLRSGHVQPLGKVLDERAAARRTRLVERDVADAAVLHEEALHILSADVKDKGDLGAELLCRAQMGKGLHLAAVRVQCRLDNRLAVASRHRARNIGICGHNGIELPQCIDDRLQGGAMIAAVGRVEQLLVPANGDELRRRRSRIDANADRTAIVG